MDYMWAQTNNMCEEGRTMYCLSPTKQSAQRHLADGLGLRWYGVQYHQSLEKRVRQKDDTKPRDAHARSDARHG